MKWVIIPVLLASALAAACSSGGGRSAPSPDATSPATNAAPTYTATARPTTIPATADPVRKTYPRGGAVDIERGMLFLDPATGGGEAWADVSASPSGRFVAWNGGDGKQPPVLYETASHRRIQLQTGGDFGTVVGYSPDESEVSVRVGDEILIASTETGVVRVKLPVAADAAFARAYWGPGGSIAVPATGARGQESFGMAVWWHDTLKQYPEIPPVNWAGWSPDSNQLVGSSGGDFGWTVLIDLRTDELFRIDQSLYNPRWSESGEYWEGQLLSGEVLIFRADGKPHMRMNGVCAIFGTPWIGDEIATWGFGQDVAVAMDGTVRPYFPAPPSGNQLELRRDGSAALVDPATGAVLADLRPAAGVMWAGTLGTPWVTPDGRGKLQLGAAGKGACENVGNFKVELAPFD